MAQAVENPEEVKADQVAVESNVKFTVCENLPVRLMKMTEELSSEAIADHGCFRIAVSGGSFPKNFAAGISDDSNVDFSKWKVFFADERCVGLESDDSNYKGFKTNFMEKAEGMKDDNVFPIKEELLSELTVDATIQIIGQVMSSSSSLQLSSGFDWSCEDHNSPIQCPIEAKGDDDANVLDSVAEKMSDQYLKDILKEFGVDPQDKQTIPSFDCIYLGMGPDGHTASLFPGHKLLDSGDLVEFITDSPKQPPHRITLTLPLICDAHNIIFVVTGKSKQEAVQEITSIYQKKDEKTLQKLPAGLVTERACGTVTWLMDKDASATSKL